MASPLSDPEKAVVGDAMTISEILDNAEAEARDAMYARGQRPAWLAMLGECLRQLGYNDDPDAMKVAWVREREDAIAQLRMICDEHGDNDWDESLYLADVIEKHLGDHLGEGVTWTAPTADFAATGTIQAEGAIWKGPVGIGLPNGTWVVHPGRDVGEYER